MKKSKKGFTLIELLVVIAIIGILSAIVLVSMYNARGKAKDARIAADMNQIRNIGETYYSNNGDSYNGLDVFADMQNLTADITNLGATPQIRVAGSSYCVYAELSAAPGKFYCVDSNLVSVQLDTDPNVPGLCEETCTDCKCQ